LRGVSGSSSQRAPYWDSASSIARESAPGACWFQTLVDPPLEYAPELAAKIARDMIARTARQADTLAGRDRLRLH
jgi:hypothetical protein